MRSTKCLSFIPPFLFYPFTESPFRSSIHSHIDVFAACISYGFALPLIVSDAVPHKLKELGGREIAFDSPFTTPSMSVYVVIFDVRSTVWHPGVVKVKMTYFKDFFTYHYFSLTKARNYISIAFLSPSNIK